MQEISFENVVWKMAAILCRLNVIKSVTRMKDAHSRK